MRFREYLNEVDKSYDKKWKNVIENKLKNMNLKYKDFEIIGDFAINKKRKVAIINQLFELVVVDNNKQYRYTDSIGLEPHPNYKNNFKQVLKYFETQLKSK